MTWGLAFAVGCATGILSGFGVGGGTLLLIYLTAFAGLPQQEAQGINLIYFLPAALTALPSHMKHHFVDWKAVIPAVIAGLIFSGLAAWFSNGLDMTLLRKIFGVFLLIVGISELFPRATSNRKEIPTEKRS
ncbi:MAG: anion permease [Firmicutes bacterium]|nr:anion permease [Bacillota bacterium]